MLTLSELVRQQVKYKTENTLIDLIKSIKHNNKKVKTKRGALLFQHK